MLVIYVCVDRLNYFSLLIWQWLVSDDKFYLNNEWKHAFKLLITVREHLQDMLVHFITCITLDINSHSLTSLSFSEKPDSTTRLYWRLSHGRKLPSSLITESFRTWRNEYYLFYLFSSLIFFYNLVQFSGHHANICVLVVTM